MLKYTPHKKGDPEYVSLIDDKTKYSGIQKIVTLSSLTKHYKYSTIVNQYNTIYNLFTDEYDINFPRNDMTWIKDNYPKLKEFIIKQYVDNVSNNNTSSSYLNTFGNLLLMIDKSRFRERSREFFLKSKEFKHKASDVIKIKEYEPFEKLKNVADQTITRYEETKKYSDMIDMLIMVMNVYMCPMRLEIDDLEITKIKPLMTDHKHVIQHNYLWIHENNVKIIINHDKVSDKLAFKGKPLIIDLDDSDIVYKNVNVTDYQKVKGLILDSIEQFPRQYLLTPENRFFEPLSNGSHNMKLKKLTHNSKMSQNVNRRAFITYYYPKVSNNVQKLISSNMRHDVTTAKGEYQKNTDHNNDVNVVDINVPYKTKSNVKKNIDNLLRSKIVKYINDTEGNPQKRSIVKYGLKQGVDGKWK
jgi:hypothetical protein